MEVGRSGYVGVKCDAFAGAQTGGALSGFFEWIEPDEGGNAITGLARGNWVKLAEVKMEGNAAVGIGGSGEFGISISNDRLAFNCKGSVVLGPGAGAGLAPWWNWIKSASWHCCFVMRWLIWITGILLE